MLTVKKVANEEQDALMVEILKRCVAAVQRVEDLFAQRMNRMSLIFEGMPPAGTFAFDGVTELERGEKSVMLEVRENLPQVLAAAAAHSVMDIETHNISLEEITEIYEFRELIEVSLLPATIERMTKPRLKRLKKALDNHLDAVRDIYLKDRLLKDMEFHLTLAKLSGNQLQINTLKSLLLV